jgi:hypothetical protein
MSTGLHGIEPQDTKFYASNSHNFNLNDVPFYCLPVCLFYDQVKRLYFYVDLCNVPDLSRGWFVVNILVFLTITELSYIAVASDNEPL